MANNTPTQSLREKYGPPPGSLTPQEWEEKTGNKLLSYHSLDGKLAMNMPMSYRTKEAVAADKAAAELEKSKINIQDFETTPRVGQVENSFNRMIGGKSGFYGSMSALEAASMRLADAAMRREGKVQEQKYGFETGLQSSRLGAESSMLRKKLDAESSMLGKKLEFEKEMDILRSDRKAQSLGFKSLAEMQKEQEMERWGWNRRPGGGWILPRRN